MLKKCLFLALCLMLLCPSLALGSESLALTETESGFGYTIQSGCPYVVLSYVSANESGKEVLCLKDGSAEGRILLVAPANSDSVHVTVSDLKGNRLSAADIILTGPETPVPSANDPQRARKPSAMVLTPTDQGIRYRFSAAGHSSILLKYKSSQQRGSLLLFPDEQGTFSGDLRLDRTYRRSNVYLEFWESNGKRRMSEAKTRKGDTLFNAEESEISDRLKGVVVCVDPGHQAITRLPREPIAPGSSPAKASRGGMAMGVVTRRKESIVVLEIGYLLRDTLERQGATVIMTREIEDTWSSNLERAKIAEDGGAHFMLRLHANMRTKRKKYGIQIYCPLHSPYAKQAAPLPLYKQMAEALLNKMKLSVGYALNDKTGITTFNDIYVGNNWAKMPCFLVEMGYMSNVEEDQKLSIPEYQQMLADGMANGIYEMARLKGLIP